jgi:hypothetical protein
MRKSIIRLPAAIIFFSSGYSPLFIIMVIKDIDYQLMKFDNTWISIIFLSISIISIILLKIIMDDLKIDGFPISIIEAKPRSTDIINYTIPYMISFIAFDIGVIIDLIVFFIFLLIIFVLTYQTQNVLLNPLLAMIGYSIYDCKVKENNKIKNIALLCKEDIEEDTKGEIQRISKYYGIFFNSMGDTYE